MDVAKQITLRPQDLVVALKIALSREGAPTFSQLGRSLHISASEAHAAVQRCLQSRLLGLEEGELRANRSSVFEFVVFGARYAFPIVEGPIVRGVPTGVSAPPLRDHFDQVGTLPLVWPDAEGRERGQSIAPLYAKGPSACRDDFELYQALAAFDAVRGGAAREREAATDFLRGMLL